MKATRDPLIIARFWSKVDVRRPGVCWPWIARSRHNHGYGVFKVSPEVGTVKAHRFAWAVVNGDLPDDVVLRHSCDNPPCCNPSHLVPGTQADNVADMHARGRRTYRSRLDLEDLDHIRQLARAGVSQADIAAEFNVAKSYVSMILAGLRGQAIAKGNTHVR